MKMRRLKIAVVGLIFAGMTANAQLYMGFRFDISAGQIKNDNGDKRTSEFSFGAYDDLGYRLTNAWDIGLEFGGMVGIYTNHVSDVETTTAHWLFSPYARYTVIQAGKFDIKGKGSMILEGTKDYNLAGIQLVPMVAYNINERFALQTNLNFLSFGVSHKKVKKGNASTNFNFRGNSNNVATLGDITIGFIYKF